MKFDRSSGILLHPTSLPGQYGIGDIGPQAYRWIDFLAETRCSLWQVLPLGPTGYGDSPYQCFSAFAGNPYLISPELLLEEGLLEPEDLTDCPDCPPGSVDYGTVIEWKLSLLEKSFNRFRTASSLSLENEYQSFQNAKSGWLEDFTLFMALKVAHQGSPWTTWARPLRQRHPKAISEVRQKYSEEIQRQVFYQFLFFHQLGALRLYAAKKGIKIIGDIPIFVAHDSADVWAHPELFYLDKRGSPSVVAGVPPDYFSATGQLWGNTIYNWGVHAETGFTWWLERFQAVLEMVDIVRLDHFRGFAGYWEIPGKATTATNGRWVPSPGMDLLKAVKQGFGDLPIKIGRAHV